MLHATGSLREGASAQQVGELADFGRSSHFAFSKMLFTRKASLEATRPTNLRVAAMYFKGSLWEGAPAQQVGELA